VTSDLRMTETLAPAAPSRRQAPRSRMIAPVIIIVHSFRGASFGGTPLLARDVTTWKTQHHVGECGKNESASAGRLGNRVLCHTTLEETVSLLQRSIEVGITICSSS